MPTLYVLGPIVGAVDTELNRQYSLCPHIDYVLVRKRDDTQINMYDTKKIMQKWPLKGGDV